MKPRVRGNEKREAGLSNLIVNSDREATTGVKEEETSHPLPWQRQNDVIKGESYKREKEPLTFLNTPHSATQHRIHRKSLCYGNSIGEKAREGLKGWKTLEARGV